MGGEVQPVGTEPGPGVGVASGGRVLPLERLVTTVVGRTLGEVGAAGRLHHPVGVQTRDLQGVDGALRQQLVGGHHPLARHEGALGGHGEEVVEVQVRPEELPVAGRIGPVHVHQRHVDVEGGHRHQLRAVSVGARHRLEVGVVGEHVRSEARPGGVERHPVHGRQQPQVEGALVELSGLHRARLAGDPEMGLQRDGVERHEAVGDPADPAGRAQQADVRSAVAHDVKIGQVASKHGPHQRHRFAARAPAADADGHAAAELGDDVIFGHALVSHRPTVERLPSCRYSASVNWQQTAPPIGAPRCQFPRHTGYSANWQQTAPQSALHAANSPKAIASRQR